MANPRNEFTEPALHRLHSGRLVQRDIDQLLGICEFALQDGHIDRPEAESLLAWLSNHSACLETWPANVLFEQLVRLLSSDHLKDEDHGEILSLVMSIAHPCTPKNTNQCASLAFDDPPPIVTLKDRNFCLTGLFNYGTREACQEAIGLRGGTAMRGITKKLHYLVIGDFGSDVWRHSSFGSKIAKAIEYRSAGIPIAIIRDTLIYSSLA